MTRAKVSNGRIVFNIPNEVQLTLDQHINDCKFLIKPNKQEVANGMPKQLYFLTLSEAEEFCATNKRAA
jgi:hypothetical protein